MQFQVKGLKDESCRMKGIIGNKSQTASHVNSPVETMQLPQSQNRLTQSHLEMSCSGAHPALNMTSTEASRCLSPIPLPLLPQKGLFVLLFFFSLASHSKMLQHCHMSSKLGFKGIAAVSTQKSDVFRLAGKTIYKKKKKYSKSLPTLKYIFSKRVDIFIAQH